jgi:hypothetical protein
VRGFVQRECAAPSRFKKQPATRSLFSSSRLFIKSLSPPQSLVKSESAEQIGLPEVQNPQLHAVRLALRRILRLALCQSENLALPSRTSCSVSRRTKPCQPGESVFASSRLKSAQSASIARSLSSRDIRPIGNVTAMKLNMVEGVARQQGKTAQCLGTESTALVAQIILLQTGQPILWSMRDSRELDGTFQLTLISCSPLGRRLSK